MASNSSALPGRVGTDGSGLDGRSPSLPRAAVSRSVGRLQAGYRRNAPWAVAAVARLRREAGRDPHASPTAWGLDHLEALGELREERRTAEREEHGGSGAASVHFLSADRLRQEERERREDTAVHIAVTLWALHQQSLRDEPMHLAGWPLGRAVRRLAHERTGVHGHGAADDGSGTTPATERVEDAGETVRRRFVRIGASSDTDTLAARLREMVLLLRSARIPLDYALLADQILLWQDENRRDEVRRTWGRDFHRRYGHSGPARADGESDEATADAAPMEDAVSMGDPETTDADS
ncbi:type I-E CRISPR-associated protein Cse2/CasB [Streptomyces sudanensis]|uniref:type I-E CRISPR-associated protein Cse2/CasB n=1 Tax=Streptomyces sudanensis TaxID=436397 RepID=UPI0020CDE570|nr:type I-E CRISPR-associated protein Cse2/CasB [Streptomyces sudanensis]MCP9985829.1 type I-E CRISPR-associated protein Cse2/CasB [Streptomyces sudanensis]